MATQEELKKRVLAALDTLPVDALREVAVFVDYQRYKLGERAPVEPHYKAVSLGGLWNGVRISDVDIAEVRREIWRQQDSCR
ncbi:MAG: hypothetical protein HY331_02500 [Chloroflexi bacterium]|nr:hypothetical protein [Chloroflexota bacterium]